MPLNAWRLIGVIREKNYLHPFILWLILLLWYLLFAESFLSSPKKRLDNFITEQSFWFFNKTPEEAKKITIVAIDEDSRKHLNLKWPWKRSITAELVRNIASLSPAVIGLDIVFAGISKEAEDNALISAFKSHPNVVLAYVLNKHSQEKPFQGFIDAVSSIGFVNKPSQRGVVDKTRTFLTYKENGLFFSLEVEILFRYLGLDKSDVTVSEEGIFYKGKLMTPSPQGIMSLNYLVHPSNFKIIPASMILEHKVDASDFAGKIVLIGVTDPLIHDEYPTPLGVWPGVTIIGNSLVMLLNKRFVHGGSPGQNYLSIFILGLFIIIINCRFKFIYNSFFTFIILLMTFSLFIYLRAKGIQLSYLSIFFSGITAYIVPNLYKYLNLLYLSNRLKNLAVVDPLTGFYTPRFFLLQLNDKLKMKKEFIFVGLRLRNYKELTLRLHFNQIKSLSRLFGNRLKSRLQKKFRKAIAARISNDTIGIVIEEAGKEEVTTFFRDFIEKAEEIDWTLSEEKIKISPQACLIHRTKEKTGGSDDVIYQMERLLIGIKKKDIPAEDLEEAVGEKRGTGYKDILDFIAYDWEERNKDLEKSLSETLEANKRLDQLNKGTLIALARTIDAKSKWTAGHSERVTQLAFEIGQELGLSQDELDNLHRASLLHDIGKIGTPAELIDKADKLTDEEYQILREHPSLGERILEPLEAFAEATPMVKQHHEWFNGKGYPDGLAGEEINIGARIMAVADVYDALCSERPYRDPIDHDRVIEIIKEKSGSHFDPKVTEALFRVLKKEKKFEKTGNQ